MQLIVYTILVLVILINIQLIFNDIKFKKIPNRSVGILLILGIVFLSLNYFLGEIGNLWWEILKILIISLLSFSIYYGGFWGAGDAKYFIVLSFFLIGSSFTSFIGNVGIITLLYLLGYFVYFYLRCIIQKEFGISLFKNIGNDIKERGYYFLHERDKRIDMYNFTIKIGTKVLEFLTLFTILRLSRLYILEDLAYQKNNFITLQLIEELILKYPVIVVLAGILLSLFIYKILKFISSFLKVCIKNFLIKFIYKEKYLSPNTVNSIFLILLSTILLSFLAYEYLYFENDIIKKLRIIFTLYISIYFFVLIILYIYKITFHVSEYTYKTIKDIEVGDIIDKKYLINIFYNEEMNIFKNEGKISFKITEIIKNLENPIDKEGINGLKSIYKKVNSYNKLKEKSKYKEIIYIRTINTFAFSLYLFLGACITYIYNDTFIIYITKTIIFMIKKLFTYI